MVDDDIQKKPELGAGDHAHTLVKAGLSAIPIIGAPAAEIFTHVIVTPIQKRRDEWLVSIAKKLKELEEKVDGFNLEDLSKNEMFITTFMHATQVAIRNHQEEKLDALRNAVLNASLPNAPEDDTQLMFLSFIDTLAPMHLKILKFFDEPKEWAQRHNVTFPHWSQSQPSETLELTFPELHGRQDFYDILARDLANRGLMNDVSLHTGMGKEGVLASRTTAFGKEFLHFIESPNI